MKLMVVKYANWNEYKTIVLIQFKQSIPKYQSCRRPALNTSTKVCHLQKSRKQEYEVPETNNMKVIERGHIFKTFQKFPTIS